MNFKVRNDEGFRTIGTRWSTWIPAGTTATIWMSADGVRDHYIDIAEVPGPDVFQCVGYNEGTFFKVTGPDIDVLDILA